MAPFSLAVTTARNRRVSWTFPLPLGEFAAHAPITCDQVAHGLGRACACELPSDPCQGPVEAPAGGSGLFWPRQDGAIRIARKGEYG
jgi:hypothetical protein